FAAARLARPAAANGASGGADFFGSPTGFRLSGSASLRRNRNVRRIDIALRRGEPTRARELLHTDITHNWISAPDAAQVIARIAASYFYNGETGQARSMAHMSAEAGVPLGLWIEGLSAWKQKDYVVATRAFASLAQTPSLADWDRAAASFWAYRGARHIDDKAQAVHWLAQAAQYRRSFYGYMAAHLMGHRAEASWKLPAFTAKQAALLARYPAGWEALALIQSGRTDLAEGELRRLGLSGHHDLQTATLALAERAGMPSLTLQLGGIVTNSDGHPYDAALYPVPPWKPAGGFKIDRALIYALMKRESQFDPDATSQRGACGLMQIMPSTARGISSGIAHTKRGACPARLFDPATNIALGQKYVRVLSNQPAIGNNLMLLLTAYNGGPGNLAHWLGSTDNNDPLLFMESLPVRETRDYVQQVLLHYWMYRSRLAEPEISVAQLANGKWPRYALHVSETPAHNIQAQASLPLEVASR
ncbi:MAG: lytic transglycosylase domain-containing protein, partial [Alphaproteobacteria bacterium]|nr:lytic transglycosylase domain-containing protein [Alphaproteobacteria bacterium]